MARRPGLTKCGEHSISVDPLSVQGRSVDSRPLAGQRRRSSIRTGRAFVQVGGPWVEAALRPSN
jgi:hypothetical protein